MMKNLPQKLLEQGLITTDQFSRIEPIVSGKIVSVYYELRTVLYLGVMLLTTGLGILIYQNMGDLGHLLSILLLMALTVASFVFVFKKKLPYGHGTIKHPLPYFDYIVLLGSLLFVSVLTYLQIQYEVFDNAMGITTLITALFFFYVAYRFDHLGVLSLAITAFASFWSISVSPQKWYSGDFFSESKLHITGIIFSTVLSAVALYLDKKSIKKHFTFTYLNFCCLIFFSGALTGLFMEYWTFIYFLLIVGGCVFAYYMARYKKSFLFMLYAFLSAYIATTYLLIDFLRFDDIGLWFFYSVLSCGGFIAFIMKFKDHFKR